jgi:hypothetical protein
MLNIILFLGRHITCQIDSKEDSSLNNTSTDINSDGIYTNGDHQQQSLMRPHPLHVKVTLILSRNYFSLVFFFYLHFYSFRF